jgi:Ca2+-binding EF-hand superfamily protein
VLNQKLPGFYYTFQRTSDLSRLSHDHEMKIFFEACNSFFKPSNKFKFLFSRKGKLLHCLHEIEEDAKVVVVGTKKEFKGIGTEESPEKHPMQARSPIYRTFEKGPDTSIMPSIESQFVLRSQKVSFRDTGIHFPARTYNRLEIGLRRSRTPGRSLGGEELKLKLGNLSHQIDRFFPTLCSQGLAQLRQRCKFNDSQLHQLYGKFKLLVLLSCGIDINHLISDGISKRAFVEYYSKKAKNVTMVMERIFESFDADGGGSISWEEFLGAMDIIWNGGLEEKLDLFFSVYDKDGNGALSFWEIQELCKIQLQLDEADQLLEELSYSFAGLIFHLTQTDIDQEVPAERIKELIKTQQDMSLINMFCSFNWLKNN